MPDRPTAPTSPGSDDGVNAAALAPWGFTTVEVAAMRGSGAFGAR